MTSSVFRSRLQGMDFGDGTLAGLPTCSFGDDVGLKSKAKAGKKINRPSTH
ncbi:hypothetical protein KIN20_027906 [Parelaphostrongylus tenuis]|uniref:Uncharacterized protein n=1 Tax=Parelaphostrongylus tenuis TaxID=148309 RepID=A0AAD5R077_PARTN|nr:hypothetical protein KIN20_027906 [Parelaphostrongylus tenuis]